MRVLIAEDELRLAFALARGLRRGGWRSISRRWRMGEAVRETVDRCERLASRIRRATAGLPFAAVVVPAAAALPIRAHKPDL